jgi:hypothetical protein
MGSWNGGTPQLIAIVVDQMVMKCPWAGDAADAKGLMTHSAATHARCACILVHILHPRVWLHFELGWHTSSLTSSSEKCKSAIVVLLASILNQSCQFTCLDVFTEQQKHQLQRTRTEQTYGEAFPPNLGAKGESCLLSTPKTDKKWTHSNEQATMNRFMSWR